jgi:hypothetical protein
MWGCMWEMWEIEGGARRSWREWWSKAMFSLQEISVSFFIILGLFKGLGDAWVILFSMLGSKALVLSYHWFLRHLTWVITIETLNLNASILFSLSLFPPFNISFLSVLYWLFCLTQKQGDKKQKIANTKRLREKERRLKRTWLEGKP